MFSILKRKSTNHLKKLSLVKQVELLKTEDIDGEIAMIEAKISAVDKEILLINQHIKEIKFHHK